MRSHPFLRLESVPHAQSTLSALDKLALHLHRFGHAVLLPLTANLSAHLAFVAIFFTCLLPFSPTSYTCRLWPPSNYSHASSEELGTNRYYYARPFFTPCILGN